jgi:BlaI family penicillinase repressor
MRKPHPTLTPQELAIMKVVWRRDEATVREVHAALSEHREIAYTTVMTLMRILQEKGYLTKATDEKAHVYRPAKPRQQVIGGMVRDFLDRVFDGASDALLVHLAKDNQLTPKQKQIVQQLLKEQDGEKGSSEKGNGEE